MAEEEEEEQQQEDENKRIRPWERAHGQKKAFKLWMEILEQEKYYLTDTLKSEAMKN